MFLVVVTLQLIAVGHGASVEVEKAFQEFMRTYDKRYDTDEQYQVAKDAFENTMREIETLRANSNVTHEVGLNEYADLPKEVFNDILKCDFAPKLHTPMIRATAIPTVPQDSFEVGDYPPSVDWEAAGALAPVRRQSGDVKKCGSCYAIGAAVVMESRFKIELSQPRVVPFSVQQLVDCSTTYGNRGCDGGRAQEAFAYSKAEGIVKESSYQYMFEEGPCKESVVKNPDDQCIRPGDIVHLASIPKANEEAMLNAVARGPVAVTLYGAPAFDNYKDGIMRGSPTGLSHNL
ncbi:thiolproteinase SmTP1, putative [Perkinsus marinus ATCC 50983]|uniref:Thiolproteinase SmTP1, putative n=1 Tax=Perkinsus marinus (strain ATCC 50983 / TXsc) TaxID=423536 RepID=C5LK29_PERM5|nr:thiolproteinase SmTP1, putative [Perkinsus marinus ATCC 50983]EER02918.1 thiolproteinase SmTP1, putative [Perkinsus marinus ATCC 50983]|eukprot:XP_002771102.1 thiolproteinase SmTP1, putative [Perkinsus marinus ATCC 50983]